MHDAASSPSRRRFLRGALLLSLTPLLFSGEVLAKSSKMPKDAVNYQNSPHQGQRCDHCRFFQKPHSCQLVQGRISSHGWCKMFTPAS